jgi:hypothetical protein
MNWIRKKGMGLIFGGLAFLIYGILMLLLPTAGFQFQLIALFGQYANIVGIVFIVLGSVMIIFGVIRFATANKQ